MLNSISFTDQRSALVKRRRSAERAVTQLRCPETLLPLVVQASRRQSVHAKGRANEIRQLDDTAQQEVEKVGKIQREIDLNVSSPLI